MMLKGVITFVCGQWFRLLVYITDIVIYVVMRNDIPGSCALGCDEGTFYCLVFSLSYVFSAFLILWVRIIYIFNYVGFIRGIRKQGRFKCTKERNLNLEIWKFSVNPNKHRIYSYKTWFWGVEGSLWPSCVYYCAVRWLMLITIHVVMLFASHGFVFSKTKGQTSTEKLFLHAIFKIILSDLNQKLGTKNLPNI